MTPEEIAYLTGRPVEVVLEIARTHSIEPEMAAKRLRFTGVDGDRVYRLVVAA